MIERRIIIVLGYASVGVLLALTGCSGHRANTSLAVRATDSKITLPAATPSPLMFGVPPAVTDSFLDHTTYALLAPASKLYPKPDAQTRPVRIFQSGLLRVTLAGQVEANGENWYEVNPGEYARAEAVTILHRSEFRGVLVAQPSERPFGWLTADVHPSKAPGAEPDTSGVALKRYTFIPAISAVETKARATWYNIGDDRWIEQTAIRVVNTKARPKGISEHDFWTEINLNQNTLAAYEGDRMVFATLIATGLDKTPTNAGLFKVGQRNTQGRMTGGAGTTDYYYTEDVPYVMYFDQGIALHGAYWHDRFGTQVSHGCVNLPPKDAEWLYSWAGRAPSGLWVWVHSVAAG